MERSNTYKIEKSDDFNHLNNNFFAKDYTNNRSNIISNCNFTHHALDQVIIPPPPLNSTNDKDNNIIGNSTHHALGRVCLPPPFLSKTYDMVEDPHTNAIISWSSTNNSFVVWEPSIFSRCLLPHFFKHNNFSSFVRQLHTYGFRKVDADRWEFANERFLRGHKHLLATIQRRNKAAPSHPNDPSSSLPPSKNIFRELESLTKDTNSIMLEVVKLDHANQATLKNVQSISTRLRATELWQQQMVALFAQTFSTINQVPPRKKDQPNTPTFEKKRRVSSCRDDGVCFSTSQCIDQERESHRNLKEHEHMFSMPSIQVGVSDYESTRVCRRLLTMPQDTKYEAKKIFDLPTSQSNVDGSKLTSSIIIMDDTSSQIGSTGTLVDKHALHLKAYDYDSTVNNHIINSTMLYDEDMVYPNGFLW
eukprot:c18329_g1_i1 orf=3-1256(-)